MTRSLIITFVISLILILAIWVSPLISTDWMQWLTSGRQWALTLIITLFLVTLLLVIRSFDKWLSCRRGQRLLSHTESIDDYRQAKRQLNSDWRLLWHTLDKRHVDSPYALPWLMVVGTDGSGKTGWLIDAGFDRVSASGSSEKSGIAFWLGEHAVIVELAGHYYTREKEQLDEYLWQYLINLLKKKRPRRPLTGVIAALSTDQLITRQPSGLMELARQLRWRLMEMDRQFGMHLHTWFLLTQADKLNGFTEFFRRRSSQRQVQPWGFFLQEGYRRDHFQQAFDLCQRELANTLLDCIHHEKDSNARQAQMRYVLQFSLLGERLRFFCEEIFQPRQGVGSPILKGIWFSSCGQYGSSINLLATELARQHSFRVVLEQPQMPNHQSYFNQQFFNRVLLNDLGNAGENLQARKLWLLKNTLLVGSMVLVLMAGLAFFWSQIQYNETLLNQQKIIAQGYLQSMKLLGNKPSPADVIQPLVSLRNLNQLYQESSHWQYHGGLLDWQTAQKINTSYYQQLGQKLVTPIVQQLHNRLELAEARHSQSLFDDLQYYLMLFKPEIRDTELLQNHIQKIVMHQRNLQKQELTDLNHLLSDVWALDDLRVQPDQELINKATQILANQVDERLIYDHIRALPGYQGTISLHDLFGSEFASVFKLDTRQGDAELPRFYSRHIYTSLDLSATSPLLKQELANLNRIKKNSARVSIVDMSRISRRVRELYFHDYIQAWHDLINRIELRPTNSLTQISQQITQLSNGNSALLSGILNTIISETSLAETQESLNPPSLTKEANKIAQSAKVQKVARVASQAHYHLSNKTISADDPAIVDQAFVEYSRYSTNLQARLTPILDEVLKEIQTITDHGNQNQALYEFAVSVIEGKKNVLNDLWQLASTDKTQSKQWFKLLASEIWQKTMTGAGHHSQALWQQNIYSFWQQHLAHRFPFSSQTHNDAQLTDLSELFGSKGLLNHYIETVLSPFLQKTHSGWHIKNIKGQQLPINQALLQQLTLIHKFQNQLFQADGSLQISYRMRCIGLTPEATELSIRDSNGRFVYRHGPQLWQERKWPGQEAEQLNISMNNNDSRLFQKSYGGVWGWMRFVADSQLWLNGDKVELKYNQKGYTTKLELALNKRGNPFSPKLFSQLNLPEKILR